MPRSLRTLAQLDSALPAFDSVKVGLVLSLHSSACTGLSLPIAPAKKVDTLSIRSFATFDFAFFVYGLSALELTMLLPDLVTADFPSLLRSLSRADFFTFPSDCSHVGSFTSVRALA